MSATLQSVDANAEERELTDGFHLIIDALKLNGLNTIYGVPGIPITDFGAAAIQVHAGDDVLQGRIGFFREVWFACDGCKTQLLL